MPSFVSILKVKFVGTCVIPLVILALAGCTTPSHVASRAKWRAPNSTLEENLLAAREMCPVGTTLAVARSRLGADGRLANYHGPTLKGSEQRGNLAFNDAPDHDDWALEYEVNGGKICLFLQRPAGDVDFGASSVTSIRSMKRIPLPKTP